MGKEAIDPDPNSFRSFHCRSPHLKPKALMRKGFLNSRVEDGKGEIVKVNLDLLKVMSDEMCSENNRKYEALLMPAAGCMHHDL